MKRIKKVTIILKENCRSVHIYDTNFQFSCRKRFDLNSVSDIKRKQIVYQENEKN